MAAKRNDSVSAAREVGRPEGWNSGQRPHKSKWLRLGVMAGLSCLMLLQYQNCGQAPQGMASTDAALVENPANPVSVIDDVKSASALSFNQKQVEIHTDVQTVSLVGHCPVEQEGAVLAWRIHDAASGQELGRGFANCQNEEFRVELAPTQDLQCDQSYQVTARLGMGEPGEMALVRRCAPDAVAEAPALKAQLAADAQSSCVLERRVGRGTGCSAVCYSSEGVMQSEETMPASSCGL